MNFDKQALIKEFQYKTSRSGGKGGQNVNKVSSKVELIWDYKKSIVFDEYEKLLIGKALINRIKKEGILQIISEEDRSQLRNKEIAVKRIIHLIINSLKEPKKRKATKPGKVAVAKRLEEKRFKALKKISRKTGFDF